MKPDARGGLVYSTDSGRMCPTCRRPMAACACKTASVPQGDGIARVSRETKGRGGKGVTLVRGLVLEADALAVLARQLRVACGAGGTVKDGIVEIQGDHAVEVIELLRAAGHTVKRAGG